MTYKNPVYQRRYEAGLCVLCGEAPPRPERQSCATCAGKVAQRYQKRKNERKSQGLCIDCGKPPEKDTVLCEHCKKKNSDWKSRNRDQVRDYVRKNYRRHAERYRRERKEKGRQARLSVLKAYGGAVCVCCGEKHETFLTLDHINNDGHLAAEKGQPRAGTALFEWLVRNDFPPGFQVLCRNCNWGKHANHGVCPHQSR